MCERKVRLARPLPMTSIGTTSSSASSEGGRQTVASFPSGIARRGWVPSTTASSKDPRGRAVTRVEGRRGRNAGGGGCRKRAKKCHRTRRREVDRRCAREEAFRELRILRNIEPSSSDEFHASAGENPGCGAGARGASGFASRNHPLPRISRVFFVVIAMLMFGKFKEWPLGTQLYTRWDGSPPTHSSLLLGPEA
jgi:hypothetical protein